MEPMFPMRQIIVRFSNDGFIDKVYEAVSSSGEVTSFVLRRFPDGEYKWFEEVNF